MNYHIITSTYFEFLYLQYNYYLWPKLVGS